MEHGSYSHPATLEHFERSDYDGARGKPFIDMAARIAKIASAEFAGAIVVVPPGDGEPIAFLTTDPKPDLMQFWATVKSRVEVRATEAMQQAAAQQDPWRGR
jgi:hypothetical protein